MSFIGAIENLGSKAAAGGTTVMKAAVANNPSAPKLKAQIVKDVFKASAPVIHKANALKDMSMHEVAKSFKNLTSGLVDFEVGLPKDGEAGFDILRKIVTPYKELFETNWKSKPENVQNFFRSVFGTKHIGVLEESRKTNTFFNEFITSAENIVGKPFTKFFGK